MLIDFNKLNLREAAQKKKEAAAAKHSPDAWNVLLRCGHRYEYTNEKIFAPVEKRYDGDLYFCDKCANGDRTRTGSEYGFCLNSVLQPIADATPLFSYYTKQKIVREEQNNTEQQQSQ